VALLVTLVPAVATARESGKPGKPGLTETQTAPTTLRLAGAGRGMAALDVPLADRLDRVAPRRWRTTPMRTSGFRMVGVTWSGVAEPTVRVRVRTPAGWADWRVLPHQHDGPNPTTDGGGRVHGTQAVWTGAARDLQVEVRGARPAGLTLALLEPRRLPGDAEESAKASVIRPHQATTGETARATTAPPPQILPRSAWGANPRWRNGSPRYNKVVYQVHIHHTAGSLMYTREDVPALLRGMYRYHTHSLGWFDIGYNFLVDKFGRAWEGRSGGMTRVVQGAHTRGFNHNSVGIAVIGRFDGWAPRRKALATIARLAAWKLEPFHGRPRGTVKRRSEGSDRYRAGRWVRLPVIDGHRDTNETACPGAGLYRKLPVIRRMTARRMAMT